MLFRSSPPLLSPVLFLSCTPLLLQILAFIAIITAAVALGNLDKNYGELDDGLEDLQPDDDWTWEQTANLSKSASGFLIFVSVFAIVIEGLIIAQRFLNFGIVDHFITICLIAVGLRIYDGLSYGRSIGGVHSTLCLVAILPTHSHVPYIQW